MGKWQVERKTPEPDGRAAFVVAEETSVDTEIAAGTEAGMESVAGFA